MAFSTSALNTMLDALSPSLLSLHTGDPGAAGTANEVTGGSYARTAATFSAAAAGSRALSSDVDIAVPATTVSWIGVWAGATFLGSVDVTDEVFAAAGTYRVLSASTSLTLT